MSDSDWVDVKNDDEWVDVDDSSIVDADKMSGAESGLRGAAQGASLGFADEITGGLEALLTDKTYKQARDESRANYKKAKEDNPGLYTTGEIGGGVATALVPGMNAVKGIKGAMGLGAAMGTLSGAGASEADNAADVALDAGKGMALGAGAGAAGYGMSKAVPWAAKTAGEKLKWLAEKSALNATGATGKQASKFKPGAGRELLDRGIVRFGDSQEKIAERAAGAVDEAGDAISEALANLDKQGVTASADNVVSALQQKIEALKGDPSQVGVVKKLESMILDITATGKSSVPIGAAEQTKRGFNKMAGNWMDPESGAAGKEAYGAYRDEVEAAARAADPAVASTFEGAKKTFGLMKPIAEAAEARAASQGQSQVGGLLDVASTAAGIATGDVTGAITAPVARRVIAPRVASSIASGADAASKFLLRSPKMQALAKSNPPAFKAMAQSIAQRVSSQAPMAKVAQPNEAPVSEDEAKQSFVDGN